jgi:hypothetical protein
MAVPATPQPNQGTAIVNTCNPDCIALIEAHKYALENEHLLDTSCRTSNINASIAHKFLNDNLEVCKDCIDKGDILNMINKYVWYNCSLPPNDFTNIIPLGFRKNFLIDCGQNISTNLSNEFGDIDLTSISIINLPTKGTINYSAPSITYTPNTNTSGPDEVKFTFLDSSDKINTVIWTITIEACEEPSQTNLMYSSLCGDSVQIELPEHYNILTQPNNGTLIISGNQVSYLADSGFEGFDSFTFNYSVVGSLPAITSNTATCSITTGAVINAVNDNIDIPYLGSATIFPLINDTSGSVITHINNIALNVGDSTSTTSATFTLVTSNSIFIQTLAGFSTTFIVPYTMKDVNNCSSSATITVGRERPPEVRITGSWGSSFDYNMNLTLLDKTSSSLTAGNVKLNIYVNSILDSTSIWSVGSNLSSGIPLSDSGGIFASKYQAYVSGNITNGSSWVFNKYNWANFTNNIGISKGADVKFEIQAFVGAANSNIDSTIANKYRTIYTRYAQINSSNPGVTEDSLVNVMNKFDDPQIITHAETSSTINYSSTNGTIYTVPVPAMNVTATIVGAMDTGSLQQETLTISTNGISNLGIPPSSLSGSRTLWNPDDALVWQPNYQNNLCNFTNDGYNNLTVDFNIMTGYELGTISDPIHGSFLREAYWEIEEAPGSSIFIRTNFSNLDLNSYTNGLYNHRFTKTFLPSISDGVYSVQMYCERYEGLVDYISRNNHEVIFYTY